MAEVYNLFINSTINVQFSIGRKQPAKLHKRKRKIECKHESNNNNKNKRWSSESEYQRSFIKSYESNSKFDHFYYKFNRHFYTLHYL